MSKTKKAYKLHNYTNEDIEKALEHARNGTSIAKAAELFGIPKSTLHAKLTGKVPDISKRGPRIILTVQEEERLATWILNKAKLGFPMHLDELKPAVQSLKRGTTGNFLR